MAGKKDDAATTAEPASPAPPQGRLFTIGEVAGRTGCAPSALRFYEENGLLTSQRTPAGHRRYPAEVIRRVSFIRTAQRVGLTLEQIGEALASLPDERTPTAKDWAELALAWKPDLDERIAVLIRMREQLDSCIGCGCLSLESCGIWNPDDVAAQQGSGARYLVSDERPEGVGRATTGTVDPDL